MTSSLPPINASFPRGLRVLVVDDEPSRSSVHHQLQQPDLGYAVTSCSSASEALSYCQTAFDVVLAESSIVAPDEISGRAFISTMDSTPVVLMSEGATTDDVMRAVQLGAVDYLDKPLSILKLKNIWQHSVRKMMMQQSNNTTSCYIHDAQDVTSSGAAANNNSKRPSLDSPGTPSHQDATEAFSAGTIPTAAITTTATVTDISASMCDVDISMADVESHALAAFNTKTESYPIGMISYPTTSEHLKLNNGCVWGTPIISMPNVAAASGLYNPHQQDPLLRRSESASTLLAPSPVISYQQQDAAAVPATYHNPSIPEGFLSIDVAKKESGGPLGLKLDVCDSLLTRINGALASSGRQH